MRINECSCGCGGSSNSCMMKDKTEPNYMFFGNLESIKRMIDEMVQMDAHEVDEILKNGHEWAVDHIASSLDDVQEVYSFIKNNISVPVKRNNDAFSEDEIFIKTFESYVNEVSTKKWKEIESNIRGRGLGSFADRVATHSKQYGDRPISEIKMICRQSREAEVYLSVTGIELTESSESPAMGRTDFRIVGRDSDWGTVSIHGSIYRDGMVQMYESGRSPILIADRKNAKDFIEFLKYEGLLQDDSEIDWRKFTSGYTSFEEAYR